MSRQEEARRIANGLTNTVETTRGKVVAEIWCPEPEDARRVLAALGRAGWKTAVVGNMVMATVKL